MNSRMRKLLSTSLLNPLKENVRMFSVEEGTHFNPDDQAAVNKITCLATHPKMEEGYIPVGRVAKVIHKDDGHDLIICKDGVFQFNNTNDKKFAITEDCRNALCFFEDGDTVTLNDKSSVAGSVIDVVDDIVIVRIKPEWGI